MEFLKSGPDRWVSRNNNYVIELRGGRDGFFMVMDGHGKDLQACENFDAAATFAHLHQEGKLS